MNKLVYEQMGVPAEYISELERFRSAALSNTKTNLMGQVLRFKKGNYVFGSEKHKVAVGTKFIAIMHGARHGWIKWNADKTATNVVGKIIEGFVPPPRTELDCRDEEAWPTNQLSGKVEDPWKHVVYLPLMAIDGTQLLTFSTTTKTGIPAFWKFVDRYQ